MKEYAAQPCPSMSPWCHKCHERHCSRLEAKAVRKVEGAVEAASEERRSVKLRPDNDPRSIYWCRLALAPRFWMACLPGFRVERTAICTSMFVHQDDGAVGRVVCKALKEWVWEHIARAFECSMPKLGSATEWPRESAKRWLVRFVGSGCRLVCGARCANSNGTKPHAL